MPTYYPLTRETGAIAPKLMTSADKIPADLLPAGLSAQSIVVTLAAGAVGKFIQQNSDGSFALATNADKSPIIGVITEKVGNDCTVLMPFQKVDFTSAHSLGAPGSHLWLSTAGNAVNTQPTTPVGGKSVYLGHVVSALTIMSVSTYVEEG